MPCAIFLVCMTLAISKAERFHDEVSAFLEPVRGIVTPASEGMFAGSLDISTVPYWRARLGFRLSVLFGAWSEGDHRDWRAVRTWAYSLPPLLLPDSEGKAR